MRKSRWPRRALRWVTSDRFGLWRDRPEELFGRQILSWFWRIAVLPRERCAFCAHRAVRADHFERARQLDDPDRLRFRVAREEVREGPEIARVVTHPLAVIRPALRAFRMAENPLEVVAQPRLDLVERAVVDRQPARRPQLLAAFLDGDVWESPHHLVITSERRSRERSTGMHDRMGFCTGEFLLGGQPLKQRNRRGEQRSA